MRTKCLRLSNKLQVLPVGTVIFVGNLTYICLIATYTRMYVIGKIQNISMDAKCVKGSATQTRGNRQYLFAIKNLASGL